MKPRHRIETPYQTEETRATFLYGRPNRGKQEAVRKAQEKYASMVNGYVSFISGHPELLVPVIKNDHKDPGMRKAERSVRPKDVNSAFSQNAFDQACTLLSSRLDTIRTDMLRTDRSFLVRSKVLFAMTLQSRTKEEMEDAVRRIISAQKRLSAFHKDCLSFLRMMDGESFHMEADVIRAEYRLRRDEVKLPEVRSIAAMFDSRLCRLEKSYDTACPYVIVFSDPLHKKTRYAVPLDISRDAARRLDQYCKDSTCLLSIRKDGTLRVQASFKKKHRKPDAAGYEGVDTGITDSLHTSSGKAIGSMKPVLDEYYKEVEPSFAGLSDLRNKKRKICHFIRKHKSLPDDVRRSLIDKADRLERMIRTSGAPYRKKRRYYQHLDEEIRHDVDGYISSIGKSTVTVLEKLDIREFHKGRKANGRMSTFAKGKLQKKLMEELNWHGYAFMEVEPDYTSQICPVCGSLKAGNRSGKLFRCACCGYEDDADHVGALNIRSRAADDEVLSICERYRYQHKAMQKSIVSLYQKRHRAFLLEHPMPMLCLPNPA